MVKLKSFKTVAVLMVIMVVVFFATRPGNTEVKTSKTSEVKKGEVVEVLSLSGEILANNRAVMAFQSSGTVASIGVKEGDLVKKGQFLGKIDTTKLNSDLQRAQSDLRAAEASVAKIYDDLKDKGNSETFSEKETRTTAEVAKDKAYEAYVKAQKDLRDATIYSPIAGVVTMVNVDVVGANVTAGVGQFEIVDPSSLYFSVKADQSELGDLKTGKEVSIMLDSDGMEYRGLLSSIGFAPKSGETETVYEVKIEFLESPTDVRVGLTGDMDLVLKEAKSVLYVEPQYVNSDKDGKYLLVGKDKKRVNVEVGLEGEDRVEVKSEEISEGLLIHD